MDTRTLEQKVAAAFPAARIEVADTTGGGDHFAMVVVSERFEGMPIVRRHRLVYEALGDLMRAEVHALSLQTLTPAEHAAD